MSRVTCSNDHDVGHIWVAAVSGICVLLFVNWLVQQLTNKKGIQGIPADSIPGWKNPPADPIQGDLGIVLACGSLQDYLMQQHQGGKLPIVSFWWKNKRVVSVCTPRGFKETENLYLRPAHVFGPSSLPIHGSDSIENVNGAEWERKKSRLHNTIRGNHLKSFINDFIEIAQNAMSQWEKDGEIMLKRALFQLTLKGILVTSLGTFGQEWDDESEKKVAFLYDCCKESAGGKMLDPTPLDIKQEKEYQTNLTALREYMKKLLNSRKEERIKTKALPLIDALLSSGVPEEEILSDMVTFLGGFHTSGFYCIWVFLYLANHPHVQEKLALEINNMVGTDRGGKLEAYVLTSNFYLRQVLDEVMRLSSTVDFSGHFAPKDITVEGYHIPANTPIIHAIGVAMQNPAVWGEDSKLFKPDRFSPGGEHAKRGHEFRPFGVSCARRCPANLFVYTMISVYITVLIQHFVVSAMNEKEVGKKYGIATQPKGDIHLRVTPRE